MNDKSKVIRVGSRKSEVISYCLISEYVCVYHVAIARQFCVYLGVLLHLVNSMVETVFSHEFMNLQFISILITSYVTACLNPDETCHRVSSKIVSEREIRNT